MRVDEVVILKWGFLLIIIDPCKGLITPMVLWSFNHLRIFFPNLVHQIVSTFQVRA